MKMIALPLISVSAMSVLLYGCYSPTPTKDDIKGRWYSADGAVIELRADGSYVAKQIDYNSIYLEKEYKGKKIDFVGKCEIISEDKKWKLELYTDATFKDIGINKTYTYNGEIRSHRLGLTFEISGEGILENKPPWHLFVWIGDPDNGNRYKFEKR